MRTLCKPGINKKYSSLLKISFLFKYRCSFETTILKLFSVSGIKFEVNIFPVLHDYAGRVIKIEKLLMQSSEIFSRVDAAGHWSHTETSKFCCQ